MVEGITNKVNELTRDYVFPGNWHVFLKDVIEITIRPSGTHRAKTKDGHLHIIATGWLHVDINSPDDWVF